MYSVDTSALVEAWVRTYPPDVFPTLWERIENGIETGRLRATDEVLRDLAKKEDDLYTWSKCKPELFLPLDGHVQSAASAIINDARFSALVNLDAGRGESDPFVIACAQVHGFTVVTMEKFKPTKPKIPDVCATLGVPCINLLELFRREGWRA